MHPFRNVNARSLAPWMVVAICVSGQLASTQNSIAQSDLGFDPYPVYVAQQEAFTRCGPSGEFYRTDPLRHGQELRVYAETDDGWLGIRPPNDSFCWIPAETVEMDASDEKGTVIEDRTVAWIGTHLGRARTYRWQVQLAKGEPVTVLGRSEREGPDGPQLWYRIVPPSGEFRWVHRDQVVFSSEELVASISRPSDPDPTTPTEAPSTAKKTDFTSQESRRGSTTKNVDSRVSDSNGVSILESNTENWKSNAARPSTEQSAQSPPSQAPAPESSPRVAPARGAPPREAVASEAPTATVTEAMKRGGLLASVEFLSRPRLLEIGSVPGAPRADEAAADTNWVAGATRPSLTPANGASVSSNVASTEPATSFAGTLPFNAGTLPFNAGTLPFNAGTNSPIANGQSTLVLGSGISSPQNSIAPNSIAQVSGQQQNTWQPSAAAVMPAMQTTRIVSAERIAQIETETRGADFDRLSLIFSRLIASQATSAEIEPVSVAARQLASSSLDSVVAGRARELAERAERYRRVATQRDGQAVIRTTNATFPVAQQPFVTNAQYTDPGQTLPQDQQATGVDNSIHSGYLVQVYSARTNSPPFALTDNTGRTVAYVTPSPGVNLRIHLNSKVSISGNAGFLTGLNTPHILATQAVRTPE